MFLSRHNELAERLSTFVDAAVYGVSTKSNISCRAHCYARPCPVSSRSVCAHVMHVQALHVKFNGRALFML